MLRYYITDGRAIGGEVNLLRNIRRLGNSIDIVQVREKHLAANDLVSLVRNVLAAAHPDILVLVNDRADVALATGAHGVHLRGNAIPVHRLRRILPTGFQISVSCHSVEDVRRASQEQADLALLAPVFSAPQKGPALGLGVLREAAHGSTIPVLALGGVEPSRIAACMEAGSAGIAAIRLFQDSEQWVYY
jgi:thiamine-phosphate pyrophosphorylase